MPAALRAVPPPDEPSADSLAARSDLRSALDRVTEIDAELLRAGQARERLNAALMAAVRDQETAKARLADAEENGQARLAVLLGKAEPGAASVAELRQALDVATTTIAGLKADEELLAAEITRLRNVRGMTLERRTHAVADVVRPLAERLLARRRALYADAVNVELALRGIPSLALPHFWDNSDREPHPSDHTLADRVRAIVTSLETDADTPADLGELA